MITILASCTNSKTEKANEALTIQCYSHEKPFEKVIQSWKKSREESNSQRYLTTKLYKGVGWKATVDTYNFLSNYDKTKLYIASAGYGLISHTSKITPYNATFAPRTSNSIDKFTGDKRANIEWWDSINQFRAEDFSNDSYFFVILPHNYLLATQNFIKEMVEQYDKRVFIFRATKSEAIPFMQNYTVEFDLRFNSFQTGTLSSLLSRAVLWLSKEVVEYEIPFKHHLFQEHIEEKMKNYTQYKMPKREQLSEEEIIKKIKNMIINDKITSASKGLRRLRESGIACEQKRFSTLFKKVKGQL
jgi:hypothetical protein